ncbi:LysE family translocator [Falsiroseomonas sp.]|uniref:LysE family translocator n=1 Tax=Falsiroseomonas sp. TaxID=2870721 RepID=UPI003F6F4461
MPIETILALGLFAVISSLGPGPSNFLLLASGANFGFRRTLPQLLGVSAGLCTVMLGVGAGLGLLLAAVPALGLAVKLAGAAWLLRLAWRIGTARAMGGAGQAPARPIGFLESAGFQWMNPKAWLAAVTAMAIYTQPDSPVLSVLVVSLAVALGVLPSLILWAGMGVALRDLLSDPRWLRRFNIGMALLLVASLLPLVR